MLPTELEKLKRRLEGENIIINKKSLLEELKMMEKFNIDFFCESLSTSSKTCPTCGKEI